MDNELKQYLEARFGAIDARFEAIDKRFATIEDQVDNRFQTIEGRFQTTEARFREMLDGRLDAVEQRLKEHAVSVARDMETKILTEFHKWASVSDIRTRQTMTNIHAFDERLLAMEDRVSALERRKP